MAGLPFLLRIIAQQRGGVQLAVDPVRLGSTLGDSQEQMARLGANQPTLSRNGPLLAQPAPLAKAPFAADPVTPPKGLTP
jgi:hypothetical protein